MGAQEREKERRPQPAGETVRERECQNGRERERERMPESQKWSPFSNLHFMEDGFGRIPSSGTGISRYRHPVPSSGTGSVLEASSTAPELPFIPIPVIQFWMTVSGTGYR